MTIAKAPRTLTERYRAAARETAPKLASVTPTVLAEGYWVSDSLYFYVEERTDSSLDCLLRVPCLADAARATKREIISVEKLVELLSSYSNTEIRPEYLSNADFEMLAEHRLSVGLRESWYTIDLARHRVLEKKVALLPSALYSPSGRYACFIKGYDIWLKDLQNSAERRLTFDGSEHNAYGRESDACLAAISYHKCPHPVGLWSSDSKWFLTHRIDERSVPDIHLLQHVPADGDRPIPYAFKYPMPGDPLPVATYVAIHVDTGRVVAFPEVPDLVRVQSPFLAGTIWLSTDAAAYLLRVNRYFKCAELFRLDFTTGIARMLVSETVESGYFDPHPILSCRPNVRVVPDSQEVIWYSERDGWGHLYRYEGSTGKLLNRITQGSWLVKDVINVDPRKGVLLFTACGLDPSADPARCSLCSIGLDGKDFQIVLSHEGDIHVAKAVVSETAQYTPYRPCSLSAGVSPKSQFVVARYMNVCRGNQAMIVDMRTKESFVIAEVAPSEGEVLPLEFSALAADGITRLHGVLFHPPDFSVGHTYPLIDFIYPGPLVTHKPQAFRSPHSSPARSLAALGFVVLMVDTRGTPLRQRDLHQMGYGELNEPQLSDHAAVVRQLCARYHYLDLSRVGILGQSVGGAAAVRALCDYGEIFRVCVSLCGDHDPSRYAAFLSDKYRGARQQESWSSQSNSSVAHKVNGRLLLISGDMDDNVHPSQTLSFVDALIRANRNFDMLVIPNGGHDLLSTSAYAQRRTWDYFVTHLLHELPPGPEDFTLEFAPHEITRWTKSVRGWRRS